MLYFVVIKRKKPLSDNSRMKSRLLFFLSLALFAFVPSRDVGAEVFRFRFEEGESYRINSLVDEDVYVDGFFSHHAQITNRITAKVSDVRSEDGQLSARHDCTFMTSERNNSRGFAWGQQYESVFRRAENGRYDISDEYFMPVVRDIPVFPEGDVQPGDRWQAAGEEAHDFRLVFGIEKPFKVPFTTEYVYEGPVRVVQDGGAEKTLHRIQAQYTLFFNTPAEALQGRSADGAFPVSIMGSSRQQLYWDAEKGALSHYTEEFRIQIKLDTGNVIEFIGTSSAVVSDIPALDRERIVREMNEEIIRQNIENARVESSEEGVTITIENIQFEADTARLLPGEERKVRQIAQIIARYPDNDILVTGHTALAGSAEGRQRLSEERAEAVAAMLISLGARKEQNVFTQGAGAERPIAPNDTEENRARNRRVEITLLEK